MSEKPANYVLVNEMERLLQDDGNVTLIDARTSEEFIEAHVPGAINVPVAELADFAQKHCNTSDDVIVTMCGSKGRGEKALYILRSHGIANVQVLKGGLKAWREAGFPLHRHA